MILPGMMEVLAQPSTGGGGAAPCYSPGNDEYTMLLLHSNTTDGNTTFTDSSSRGHTVTANGTARHVTAQQKFGTSSIQSDDASSYLSLADSDDWDFGTGDFTVDFWLRPSQVGIINVFPEIGDYSSSAGIHWFIYENSGIYVYLNGGGSLNTFSPFTPSANTWHHFALTRSGTSLRMFVNGVQIGATRTNSTNMTTGTHGIKIGAWTTYYTHGQLDELRISRGIARWTSNFTPPDLAYCDAS